MRIVHGVVALAALAAGCSHTEGDADVPTGHQGSLFEVPANQRAHLQVAVVHRQLVVRPVRAPARIAFDDLKTSEVTPLVSGKVAKVFVHEGDHVKVGQPLLAIASPDASDTAANLARDTSALRSKQTILARDEDLYTHKAISLEELQQARLDVESAKTTVYNDQSHAALTGTSAGQAMLLSPIDGTVVSRKVSVGDPVQPETTTCFTITDPSAIWVVTQLYQEDLRRVALDDKAQIRSPVLDAPLDGKVIYIGASIDADTLTIPVRIAAQNANGLLKNGMYVDVEILPAKSDQAIVVPAAAVLRDADNLPFVYLQVKPATFARRHVKLAAQLGDTYAIEQGLDDGAEILTDGALFVQFADSLEQ
ncbi:MAG TPA: efflux RND transporter periplasmic adaptor subunit [Kofleriaceae bacterium]